MGQARPQANSGAVAETPMVVPEAPMRAKIHPCPGAEVLAPISVASHPDREVESQIGDDPRNKVGSISPGQLEGTDKGSHPAVMSPKNTSISGNPIHRHQWKVSNQFSPLGNLGREGDPWSEEVEEVFTEVPSISDKEGCDSQIGMTASEAAYADGMQNCESELLFLPWGQSGADTRNSGNGENNSSPLECVPLS